MAEILDFNLYRKLTMTIVLKDEQKTVLHLCAPTKRLADRIQQNLPVLQAALSGDNADASRTVYELAASLMSCNLDGVTVTPEALAKRFEMNLEDMLLFYDRYLDFLEQIKNEKN